VRPSQLPGDTTVGSRTLSGNRPAGMDPRAVVFLDKDGTLVEDVPYNADPARVRLLPGAGEAARALHAAGWRLAVVTNQSGVARGLFAEAVLVGVEARLRELLADWGAPLAGFFYCPHHPDGRIPRYVVACGCRKPEPGLILTVAVRLGVAPADCWMVGDRPSAVEAGRRAGCRTIRLADGTEPGTSDVVVTDLRAAATVVLAGT
jgi:D-glycero-D-manno-heptose 1,7-bisphosphate phosphatase